MASKITNELPVEHEQATEETENDNLLKELINVYKPLLLEHVESTTLVHTMTHIVNDKQKKMIFCESSKDPVNAMEMLLQILSASKEPGRYQCFLDALNNADYPYISKILRGKDVKCGMEEQTKVIQIFTPEIQNGIDATLLMPHLFKQGVINRRDKQEVEAIHREYGAIASCIALLGKVPHRSETWFEDFIFVLVECNFDHVAKLIDPDIYQKKLSQKRHKETEPNRPDTQTELQMGQEKNKEQVKDDDCFYSTRTVTEEEILVTCPAVPDDNNESGTPPVQQASDNQLDDSLEVSMDKMTLSDTENMDDDITEIKRLNTAVDLNDSTGSVHSSTEGAIGFSPNIYTTDNRHYVEDHNSFSSPEGKELFDKTIRIEQKLKSLGKETVEPLVMRDYQMELAKPGLDGKNTLVCAPTGSGKTHVAMKIIQNHLEQRQTVRKVIFLVNQVALADQQAKLCQKFLNYHIRAVSGESQRNEQVSFADLVQMNDVLVVTAQILLDSLINHEIHSIDCFTLMIFDECHHTHTKHPFNQIMFHYMDLKAATGRVPQIIGLTASVGVGKAKTLIKAKEHIKTLMANLDAEEITTVRENLDELGENVSYPFEEVVLASNRKNNLFRNLVTTLMDHIEKMMRNSENAVCCTQLSVNKVPSSKGSEQYTQWISQLWKDIALSNDQSVRRFFMNCRNHLEWYNDTLIIYADARVTDSLRYLKGKMDYWKETANFDETEEKLRTFYQKSLTAMEHCMTDPECNSNPKLERLKEMIILAYRDNSDSRGIIFVKTRNLVKAIENWMNETPELKALNPVKFVGAQACVEKGGMTKNEQVDIMAYFKQGRHKLIIATSIAQEGLDISKCNLVIMYDHVTNEIAMVQSRGRARAEDSSFILLTEQDKGTAEKQELNLIREALMNKAMAVLQDDIHNSSSKVADDIKKIQEDSKLQRCFESENRNGRYKRSGEFELRCIKCTAFGCMSSDIRRIQNAHHVVMDTSFTERIKIVRYPRPNFIDVNYEIKGKINCKNCGQSFGTIAVHKHIDFYVIKIVNFRISDCEDRATICKQWKKSPFEVKDLTGDDFKEIVENRYDTLNNLDGPHEPHFSF